MEQDVDPDEAYLPPADLRAEQSVLGALLLSPDAIHDVVEHIRPGDLYKPAHQEIYEGVLELFGQGEPVDAVTVADTLQRRGTLTRVGGLPYLHTLIQSVPTAANAAYYAEIVAEKAMLRGLLMAGQRTVQLALAGKNDPAEAVERARAALDELAVDARGGASATSIDELANDALQRYADPSPPSLSTGWADLDDIMAGGLRDGTLTVVAGRPGLGKSNVACCLALNAARAGHGVLFASLEMTKAEVTDRLISNMSNVRLHNLTEHRLSDDDWSSVESGVARMNALPLRISDDPYLTVAGVRSLARDRMRTERGLDLVIVDYLQLVKPPDERVPRQEQVSAMSRGFKLLAKELGCPIVLLAQLNRESEKRQSKRPALSDLRESGAVEQDADSVWLLHRPEDEARAGEMDLIVAKNRQGPTWDVTLAWSPHFARISGLALADR